MFFLATASPDGQPQCSYKGGDPASSACSTEQTLAFPDYNGNGMYLSLGNVVDNPRVGMIFIDFTSKPPRRLRLNGVASIDPDDPLLPEFPGAQLVVRVRATSVFGNCPRYIHRMELVERSRFVPHVDEDAPIPDWKRRPIGPATCCPRATPPSRPTCSSRSCRTELNDGASVPSRPGMGPGTSSA